jgi:hypothetical protein
MYADLRAACKFRIHCETLSSDQGYESRHFDVRDQLIGISSEDYQGGKTTFYSLFR